MKKNDQILLDINDIGVNGEGIGKVDGYTFFVKGAVIGDSVRAVITKVNKGYGFAKALEILKASEFRVKPPCPVARRCGGCQLMELSYEKQLSFKTDKVRNNLERLGGCDLSKVDFRKTLGMPAEEVRLSANVVQPAAPLHYRNKVIFPVGRNREGKTIAGFYAGRTHYIIEAADCPVAPEETGRLVNAICRFMDENAIPPYDETTGKGLVRHIFIRYGFAARQMQVGLVINGDSLDRRKDTRASFNNKDCAGKTESDFVDCILNNAENICGIFLNINKKNTNVVLGEKTITLFGKDYVEDEISCGDGICFENSKTTEGRKEQCRYSLNFHVSPLSFYQVNPVQTEILYSKALEFAGLTGEETVWDLYCGTGTISLFLSQKAKKVIGVEIVPAAIENAKQNAARNGITNAEFVCGKSEEVFPAYAARQMLNDLQGVKTDSEQAKCYAQSAKAESDPGKDTDLVVVLDPPRKGCDAALLRAIKKVGPDKIVYVSCDSATLARDIKELCRSEEGASTAEYVLEKVQPVDMFPHTVHVETVVLMTKHI